jgi:hypothetical protein
MCSRHDAICIKMSTKLSESIQPHHAFLIDSIGFVSPEIEDFLGREEAILMCE